MGFGAVSRNPGDVLPPDPPTTVTAAELGPSTVEVSWTPSTDTSGISGYIVAREGGGESKFVEHPNTFTTFTSLSPGVSHTFFVRAVDSFGSYSGKRLSNAVTLGGSGFDPDADWLFRRTRPGVYYAMNFVDRHTGIEGSRVDEFGLYSTPAGELALIGSADMEDAGDGKGVNFIEKDPAIAGMMSGHASYCIRRIRRWSQRSGDSTGNLDLKLFADWTDDSNRNAESVQRWYYPTNYVPGSNSADGVPGVANSRYGIPGTCGEGKILPYLESRVNPGINNTVFNKNELPQPRHYYLQFHVRGDEAVLWQREFMWKTRGEPTSSARTDLRTHKWAFINRGQSTDQVAVNNGGAGWITGMFYNGNDNNHLTKKRRHAESGTYGDITGTSFHPSMDNGTPALSSPTAATGQEMMIRYEPNTSIGVAMAGMASQRPSSIPGMDPDSWISWSKAVEYGLDPMRANYLSAAWRDYPYGGFDKDRGWYPDLNMPEVNLYGIVMPDQWHVIEILVSDQFDTECNDDQIVYSTPQTAPKRGAVVPRFVALWAAPRGKPLKLLGYTMPGVTTEAGPAMQPDRCLRGIIFKLQNAEAETKAYSGWIIVDSTDHPDCINPTTTQFDAIQWGGAGSFSDLYWNSTLGIAGDPSGYEDWGGGTVLGFSRGALASLTYNPRPEISADRRRSHMQFNIARTQRITAATLLNPSNLSRVVNRFTMDAPMPLAPVKGDCVVVCMMGHRHSMGTVKDMPDMPDCRFYYDEIIASVEPIPAPGHPDTPLEMPWRNP